MGSHVVIRSELIETLDEARDYYRARLAAHANSVSVRGVMQDVVFERECTHLYSSDDNYPEHNARSEYATWRRGGGRIERRAFNRERARLMDRILVVVANFIVSVPGSGGHTGHEKTVLYGAPLGDGRFLRVVLRPGPGTAMTCVSAYPVPSSEVAIARRLKRAKFPP